MMMDNLTCMYYINRQGRVRSHSLCSETIKLWNWYIHNNISISVMYLLGHQNTTKDTLSRTFSHDHEWELDM